MLVVLDAIEFTVSGVDDEGETASDSAASW
jgi:hypothetical protein